MCTDSKAWILVPLYLQLLTHTLVSNHYRLVDCKFTEPANEILELTALSGKESSGKPVRMCRLARALLLTYTNYGCR